MIILLLAHKVVFQLVFDGSCALHFAHIHIVTGILHILAASFLTFESCLSTHALRFFLLLLLHLILSYKKHEAKSSFASRCFYKEVR